MHCRIYPHETCALVEDNKYVYRSQNSFKNYYALCIKDKQHEKSEAYSDQPELLREGL